MPDLWTEWFENGRKFDPKPIKWTGKDCEREYKLISSGEDVFLFSNYVIMNINKRKAPEFCKDPNIHTDHEGRAFII